MTDSESETLDRAIEKHGHLAQCDMAIEECAELIQAINKLKRLQGIGENYVSHPSERNSITYSLAYYAACSEIADVEIMIGQLEKIFDREAINIARTRKIERLKNRLE